MHAPDRWLDLLGVLARPALPHPVVQELAARARELAVDPALAPWLADVLAARAARRAAGEGWFLPASAAGPDAWIDLGLDAPARAAADRALAGALRDGADLDALRALQARLDDALRLLADGTAARVAAWTAPPRVRPVRALIPGAGLPGGAPGLVDTADLPPEAAAERLSRLPPVDVRVLHGDNRLVLRRLAQEGVVVDAALEDPPYATGGAMLPYRDAWPAGAWTALLREHLALLRDVLAPDGLVALHVDEHQGARLELLLRETFGDGALGTVIWDKRNPKGDARGIAVQHERIEWACRDPRALHARGGLDRPKAHAAEMLARAAALVAEHGGPTEACRVAWRRWVTTAEGLSEGERAYRLLDDRGRVFRKVTMAWPSRRPPPDRYRVPLVHPVTGRPCPVPARGWRNPPETMARLQAEGRLHFGPDHTTQPTRRYYLEESVRERLPSLLYHAGSDDTRLEALGLTPFPYAKPVAVLERLLQTAAPRRDAVVADLFAGSGSTAHAVLARNAADGGRRRVILAEADPEVLDGHLLPRLRAVAAGPHPAVVVVEAIEPR